MAMTIEKARLYEKYRLPYAGQAVNDLLAYIGPVKVIADIGAGTGQLAKLFAGRSHRIYAVEPDRAMRQIASDVLADFTSTEVLAGSAEQTSLPERSVDLIVVGNAFHRFEPEACNELQRILKPDGWIALFTYLITNHALADLLFANFAALKSVASQLDKTWHEVPTLALFGNGNVHTLRYQQRRTDDWTTFFGMACGRLEAPTPGDEDFGRFAADNRDAFEAFAVNGEIQIEYETQVRFGQPLVQPTVFS
jgi:ubiquinone/menaquinone biosynthesis C-methylase UbiE